MANYISQLRQSLDCDLRSFADYLYISKSTLNDAELGKFPLPAKAKVILADLEKNLNKKKLIRDVRAEFESEDSARLDDFINGRQKDMNVKLLPLENRLAKMEALYSRGLAVLEKLSTIEITSTDAVGRRHKRWLESLISLQKEKLQRVGLVRQYELKLRIERLKMGVKS